MNPTSAPRPPAPPHLRKPLHPVQNLMMIVCTFGFWMPFAYAFNPNHVARVNRRRQADYRAAVKAYERAIANR
jgi:hypothetical protein